jgi:hypothetical protein
MPKFPLEIHPPSELFAFCELRHSFVVLFSHMYPNHTLLHRIKLPFTHMHPSTMSLDLLTARSHLS